MLKVRKNESPLQCLHLRLCEWPAGLIASEMRTDPCFAAWIREQMMPDLLEFVLASPRPERLLEQPELRELADVVDDASCAENSLTKLWQPAPLPGYLDFRVCIGEIASSLGLEMADDFARRCGEIVAELENRRMGLGEAIGRITQWAEQLEDIQEVVAQSKTGLVHEKQSFRARRKLTPPAVADRYGVSPDKVLAWIRSGELAATDASSKGSKRPRYLIDEDQLADFDRRRSFQTRSSRSCSSPTKTDAIEFF